MLVIKSLWADFKALLYGKGKHATPESEVLDTDILSSLEIASRFQHAIYLNYLVQDKLITLPCLVASVTDKQVVVKTLPDPTDIEIISIQSIKKISFIPETLKNSLLSAHD